MVESNPEEPTGAAPADAVDAVVAELLRQEDGAAAYARLCGRDDVRAAAVGARLALVRTLGVTLQGDPEAVATGRGTKLPAVREVGDFRLLRTLGEGGMGVVYLAEQRSLGRLVALKVLRAELTASAAAVLRLQREARAIARLSHANVVRVLGVGSEAGVHYVAMELVPGTSLEAMIEAAARGGRGLPIRDVLELGAQLAAALGCAHAAGVLHRDVKPANVRVTPEGRAVLLDFGLSRSLEDPALTRLGHFQGTPHYAAPEQISPAVGPVDERTDLYALGVTLYQALAGRTPYVAADVESLFRAILHGGPTPLRRLRRDVPRDLETVVLEAIERRPQDRYADAAALAADLRAVATFAPISVRRPGPIDRLRRACRRRPVVATAAGVAAALVVGSGVAQAVRSALARGRARAEVQALHERARALLPAVIGSGTTAGDLDALQRRARALRSARFLDEREENELRAGEARLRGALRREREAFETAQGLLFRAEVVDPARADTAALLAELYTARWRTVDQELDAPAARELAALARGHDHDGRFAAELRGMGTLSLTTQPAGAAVHLFRLVDGAVAGEPRIVPVPWRAVPPLVPPGTRALRVVASSDPELLPNDLIVEAFGRPVDETAYLLAGGEVAGHLVTIDGLTPLSYAEAAAMAHATDEAGLAQRRTFRVVLHGEATELAQTTLAEHGLALAPLSRAVACGGVPALVLAGGALRRMRLGKGIATRPTCSPLAVWAGSLAGEAPLSRLELEAGCYLALLRRAGCEDLRLPLRVRRGQETVLTARLDADGTTPSGFVAIAGCSAEPAHARFWLLEHEVLAGDYLAFLNDPTTRARIASAGTPSLYPRVRMAEGEQPVWIVRDDGSFALPADWPADDPVCAVTWRDAEEYVAWRNERARAAGEPWRFALPWAWQWERAARGSDRRPYVHGHAFRPRWAKTYFADREVGPGGAATHAFDESPFGVYDLGGNCAEWCRDWLDEARGQRVLKGGSFGDRGRQTFEIDGVRGGGDKGPEGSAGFRIVAVRDG